MERKNYLLMFIIILYFHTFTASDIPITIETLQGNWINSNNNRFKVRGTTVKRNGASAVWGELEETEHNIIINGWVLNKMSGSLEWTYANGSIVTWTKIQPITIESLQGSWINSRHNRFTVRGTSVKRWGIDWGELEETEENIIVNGWALDKKSGNFEWTDSHGAIVIWRRIQPTDHELLQNRIAETEYGQRFTLTETNCGTNVDIISQVDFEDGEIILAIPYQHDENQYHCFSQEFLLRWILEKNQHCIHPFLRTRVDVNTIVIGKFQIVPHNELL